MIRGNVVIVGRAPYPHERWADANPPKGADLATMEAYVARRVGSGCGAGSRSRATERAMERDAFARWAALATRDTRRGHGS